MFLAISSILLAISSGITMFVQTITLAGCRLIECGSSSCHIGQSPLEKDMDMDKGDDMQMAVAGGWIQKCCRILRWVDHVDHRFSKLF